MKHLFKYIVLLILISSCGGNENISDDEQPIHADNKLSISMLLPNTGSVGDEIMVTGKNLGEEVQDITVLFGAAEGTVKTVSKEKLTVLVPGGEGTVDVSVKVKSQVSNALKFTYKEAQEKLKITTKGIYVPNEVEEATTFRGVSHIRLKNGDIFTVNGSLATVSSDEGKTWTASTMVDTDNYSLASAECLQTKDGVIIVAFMNGKEKNWTWNNTVFDAPGATLPTYVVRSIDGGKTWLEPQKMHDDWTGAVRSIIETSKGTVVFTSMKLLHNPGRHAVLTYASKDNGATWTASNILDNANSRGHHSGYMESTVVELNDGRLWHLIRTNWDYLYESFSIDDGITWDTPRKTNFDASSSPHSIIRLQSGRLILAWNRLYPEGKTYTPRYGGEKEPNLSEVAASWMRHELSISFSDDDGKTWSTPRVIARYKDYTQPENSTDSSKWISYGHVVELDPGIIMITTESGGLRIKFNELDFI